MTEGRLFRSRAPGTLVICRSATQRRDMRIGVVKEIKPAERRVALTPAGARELAGAGHEVLVERGAGVGAGFEDLAYELAGAHVVADAAEVWSASELLLKV